MTPSGLLRAPVDLVRAADRAIGRASGRRRVLVDARTPVNVTMVAPICRALSADPRVEFWWTASEEPRRLREIYREADNATRLIHPGRAAVRRFDAYVASDFMWTALPRGTCRIQVFHGVGGKYGFDAPATSMRAWDRIFFANERRLRNFVRAGAIDRDSPAIRLVGLPKTDALVNGTWTRDAVLASLGFDPARPTVLYAPTWSPASSLNAMGADVIDALLGLGVNLIVKLHDRSRDPRPFYSGGVDWVARLAPQLRGRHGVIASGHDISPYLVASDLMVTDHSSAGFEYLLCDRPLVRIHRPELIRTANIHPDYVALLASVSESVDTVAQAISAVERGLAAPAASSAARRAVAADLFYRPGGATARAVRYLYEAIALDPAPAALEAAAHPFVMHDALTEEATCRP
jgi:CDP-glycerol:poly(glycerophosphate) glycerophosphotransferase